MSKSVEINGIEFITTRDAAKVSNYSNDYISKLAREGRVVGMQLGRQWFVDPTSVKNFIEQAVVEKEVRKKKLREERSLERKIKTETKKVEQQVQSVKTKASSIVVVGAMVKAAFVLVAGLTVGGGFMVTDQVVKQYAALPNSLVVPAQLAQLGETEPPAKEASVVDEIFFPAIEGVHETSRLEIVRTGFLLLSEDATATDTTELAEFFSDEVTLEYLDDHSGVVTPEFRDGPGRGVEFLSVPINQANQ
ncbi:MAG: helix-turn-helix domain-containing protein [Patescibacteria group bacterium]